MALHAPQRVYFWGSSRKIAGQENFSWEFVAHAAHKERRSCGLQTGYRSSLLLRFFFALPRAPLVLPIGAPPGTGSNPNPLGPQPFWGNPAQHGAHPRAHTAVNKNQGSRVRGAYRNDCGWIECPNRLVGWGQPPGGARKPKKAPRGRRILFACTFLRFRGRAAGPAAPLWRAVGVLRLAPGFVMFFFFKRSSNGFIH